jgi:outer membrane protein TolC
VTEEKEIPLVKTPMTSFQLKTKRLKILVMLIFLLACSGVFFNGSIHAASDTLSLESAVKAAQENDPWLVQNKHSQDAVESMSVAAGELPDPTVSLGLANFPTDTFDINQEPMTQVVLGVTQMIPRGDSLEIKEQQLKKVGSQFPFQREDRRAITAVTVGQLWLDAYKAQESIALIEEDRPLFEKLADIAEASYSTALGKTRQQDIIRAQLELTRLDDRLTTLQQQKEMFIEELSGWLRNYFREEYRVGETTENEGPAATFRLEKTLPEIVMLKKELYMAPGKIEAAELYRYFSTHPSIQAEEQKIEASKLGIELAREKYKPMWGVSASYGYRDDGSAMGDRADFVSLGVSFDLPFFTKNRQDKELQSAVSQSESVKTGKWTLVRKMIAGFEKNRARLKRFDERQRLYREQLLPQMYEQAEASLTAYTNDDGDFAEVVRSRIAELNARITALDIEVERQKTIISLNYYFMSNADEIITGALSNQ